MVRSVPQQTMDEIARAIGSIRYGYVQIVIQDSRVVQIEKAEKIRLDRIAQPDSGMRRGAVEEDGADQAAGGAQQ